MLVRDAMSVQVVTVREDATVEQIVDAMLSFGVRALPVLDQDGCLLGMIDEDDLATLAPGDPRRRPRLVRLLTEQVPARIEGVRATDLMTRDVECVGPDDGIRAAARKMLRLGENRLPVVEDGRLVGILSRTDILRATGRREDGDIARDVEHVLRTLFVLARGEGVRVRVADGVVTLDGEVGAERESLMAAALARAVAGVCAVDNRITAREHGHGLFQAW